MNTKIKFLDFIIALIFLSAIYFFALNLFTKKAKTKTLIVQTQTEKFAYSLEKNLHLEFTGLIGKSHIVISNGEAWFEDSVCENKICVESGKISKPNQWASCLPNGIIIYIESNDTKEKESLDVIAN